MLPDIGALPGWLLIGLLAGGLASVAVAALFVVANRRFPSPATATDGAGRDGKRRRREELRAYLQAIGEAVREDHVVAGETVAFYLPERDVALTFDAEVYFRIAETGTEAVLLEYELPATALGTRLPFEVPDVHAGFDEGGATAADFVTAAEALDELGLSPPASGSAVESAYRDRVKETHPDLGGDRDEFRRVREAYATAKQYAAD